MVLLPVLEEEGTCAGSWTLQSKESQKEFCGCFQMRFAATARKEEMKFICIKTEYLRINERNCSGAVRYR